MALDQVESENRFGVRSDDPRKMGGKVEEKAWWEQCYQDPDAEAFGPPSTEITALASVASGNERVLDIGCGEGRNSFPFIERGCMVYGFDSSLPALMKFKRRLGGGTSCWIWAGDVRAGLPATQFDVVICHGVLHFFPPAQRDRLLDEMQAATTRGGHVVIAAFNTKLPPPEDMAGILKGLYEPGQLLASFHAWDVVLSRSYSFEDSHPGGVHHVHSIDKIVAKKP